MTTLFNIFTSLEDSIYKITNNTNTGNERKHKNSEIRAYNNQENSLHATSLHQGKQFKKYQDRIINKNKKNIYKVNSREGFQGTDTEDSSSSQTQSQQVLSQTAISPEQSDTVKNLYLEQKVLLDKHKELMVSIDGSANEYFARVSKKNPYLNKIVVFTTGHCCYVTNQGVVRYIPSWDMYYSTGAPKELVNKLVYLTIPLPNDFWTPGSLVPTKPPLISGPNIVQNQSLGHEGNTVFVDRMIQDPIPSYSGCYADNQSQSLMTFIGGAPPSTTATIVNGNFAEPALSNDSYVYYNDTTSVPGWDFINACLINNSSAWGYVKPYPEGNQAVSIQGVNNMTQVISMVSGSTYTLAFYATGRPSPYASGPVDIQLNGDTVYSFTPPTSSWQNYSVPLTASVTGNNTLNFVGTTNDADYSTAIQYITLGTDSSSGGGTYSFQDCQTAAINLGYQYFGLQNVNSSSGLGYCAVSNNEVSAVSLGTSNIATSITALWSSGTTGSDPGVSASITNTGSLVVYNSAGTAIYTSPGATPSNYYGCYGDGPTRAITDYGSGGATSYTYSSCMQEAQNAGYSYFGLQYVQSNGEGQCFYGNDINQARGYGMASNCTLVNGDTYGGGWSNAVYGVNPGVDFFLDVQDDGNLCVYRGQGPSDNQGIIWATGTNGKQQDANPQYQASNGLYGLSYLTTGQTLAPGDFIGNTDGSTYLIMQTDGNLVLYTSTMGLNCSTINSTTVSKSKSGAKPMGGGQYATALYELAGPPGIPGQMGQIGYVDEDSNLYTFPDTNQQCSTNYNSATPTNNQPGQTNGQQYTCPKEAPVCKNYRQNIQWGTCSNIELTDRYTKISGTDNGGADYIDVSGNYIMYSNTTVEDCQKTCNSYNDCYGFAFSNGSCYPKTNAMSYSGTDTNSAVDLYTRNKRVANPPSGIPKETTPISTTEYSNYNYIGDISSGKTFGLGNANSVQKQMLSQLEDQINSVSNQINKFTGIFSQKDGVVQKQAGKNVQNLVRHKKELDDAKDKIGVLQDTTLGNFERIIEDTDIRVLQESYTYMFLSILAITFVLVTMNISSKSA